MREYDTIEPMEAPAPLGTVARQLGSADALANRIVDLVDRLIGSLPPAPPTATMATGKSPNVNPGKLYELEDLANRTGSSIEDANRALNRLEGHF